MKRALSPHPDFPCPAVTSLEVDVERRGGGTLALTYRLTGAIADLAIPAATAPGRADELWRHTCFEVFIRPASGEGYLELNFAPSTQWAAYRFSGYRAGMVPADIAPPRIRVSANETSLELAVALELPDLAATPWRLALTAVIEDMAGAKSYLSLAHPPGRPDFHHAAGFVLDLPESP